jgi:hypothetical protein
MKSHVVLILLVFFLFTCRGLSSAQDLVPRPYAYGGLEGLNGGYAPLALLGGTGVRVDSEHLLVNAQIWYDNARKVNDGCQPNPSGHHVGVDGGAYLRFSSGWAFGGGWRYSKLTTDKYTKVGGRPVFGGSRDFFVRNCRRENCAGDFTMRVGVDYVTKGTDWMNGSQGPLISFYMPSPSLRHHFFYRETVGIYRFHDTVTDRTDPILTREESSNHHFDSFAEFTVMYRF